MKVYSSFDQQERQDCAPGLTEQQAKSPVEAGKVATNQTALQEPEILVEDLLNGPYFGDARSLALTSERLVKILQGRPSAEIEPALTGALSGMINTRVASFFWAKRD